MCSPGFYTYAAFKAAVAAFPTFATAADDTTNKRELAGFLAQISHVRVCLCSGRCWLGGLPCFSARTACHRVWNGHAS